MKATKDKSSLKNTSRVIDADIKRIRKVIEKERELHEAIDAVKEKGEKLPPKVTSAIRELRKAIDALSKVNGVKELSKKN